MPDSDAFMHTVIGLLALHTKHSLSIHITSVKALDYTLDAVLHPKSASFVKQVHVMQGHLHLQPTINIHISLN